MISAPTYVTREDVRQALDIAETARASPQIDRAIESATASVDGCLRRRFRPTIGTRYFPWPGNEPWTRPWRLWLNDDEVISVTTLVAGGVTIPSNGRNLEPINSGPPYTSIEINQGTNYAFAAGSTWQRSIAITGTFGYRDDLELVGSLSGTLGNTPSSTANATWLTNRLGVGDLLKIDSEYILITDKDMVATGQTLQTPLTASTANVTVAVNDGSAFGTEGIILVDSERMRIVDIAGNNLTVKRAVDGSVLASHSGSVIYALTGLSLARAVQGSTIASHSSSTSIYRHVVPPLVRDLAMAYALNQLLQEQSGYARVAGTGDAQREVSGRGVRAMEEGAMERYGRQLLMLGV